MSKPSTETAPKLLCLRCDTFDNAKGHGHTSYKNCMTTFKPSKKVDTLWWDFPIGQQNHGLDLTDPEVCKALLAAAENIDATNPVPAQEETAWYAEAKKRRADANFQGSQITKTMLETAVVCLYPPKQKGQKANTAAESSKRGIEKEKMVSGEEKQSTDTGLGARGSDTEKRALTEKKEVPTSESGGNYAAATKGSEKSKGVDTTVDSRRDIDNSSSSKVAEPEEQLVEPLSDQGDGHAEVPTQQLVPVLQCSPQQSHRRHHEGLRELPVRVEVPALSTATASSVHNPRDAFTSKFTNIQTARKELLRQASQPSQYIALRPDFGPWPDSTYEVLTNHFGVTIPPNKLLYEYHVTNMPDKVTRPKRRVLILDMIEHNELLYSQRHDIATDYKQKIISITPLHHEADEGPGREILSVLVPNYKPGTREEPETLRLGLHHVATHRLDGLRDFVDGKNEGYQDKGAADALNIVIAKAVADGSANTFQVGDNRFYYRPGYHNLETRTEADSAGLVAIRGYYSAIKPAMGKILLNVNTVTGAFYKPQDLRTYLKHFYDHSAGNNDQKERKMQDHVRGLRVWVNFDRAGHDGQDQSIDQPNRRTKTLVELGTYPRYQDFVDEDGKTVSVWDHITKKYPSAVGDDDEHYPTANVGKKAPTGPTKYYMASQLIVLADQPYRRFPLPPDVTAKMIDVARRSPVKTYGAILGEGITSLGLHSPNLPHMLQSLNMTISPNMIKLPARLIAQPQVHYEKPQRQITQGTWRPAPDVKFSSYKLGFDGVWRSGQPAPKVQFFRPSDTMKYDHLRYGYVQNFRNLHSNNGLQPLQLLDSNKIYETIQRWDKDSLLDYFNRFKDRIHLAVVVFPSQNKEDRERYATFKIVMDQYLGMKSICFNEQKMVKSLQDFDPDTGRLEGHELVDYMRNCAMKLNLRCGNYNHMVRLPHLARKTAVCDTMVLGADVTHPSSGSADFTPSIAAVVGSVDNDFGLFPASMRLNPSRQEWIEQMSEMVSERLMAWYSKNNKTLPTRILYYRDGVGDDYFKFIRQHEVLAIKDAWAKLKKQHLGFKTLPALQITVVVVTKRHHTRFFPKDLTDTAPPAVATTTGNCPPGTVVDSGVTSPYYFDFYLQSHHSLQGTAKPAHYIVLENGMKMTAQQLQDTTFHLCFTYGRSTTSVSYAPPAYYADRLCERGRLYLKPLLDGREDYKGKTPEEVWEAAESFFYRDRGNVKKKNPWHTAHDGKMFWM